MSEEVGETSLDQLELPPVRECLPIDVPSFAADTPELVGSCLVKRLWPVSCDLTLDAVRVVDFLVIGPALLDDVAVELIASDRCLAAATAL